MFPSLATTRRPATDPGLLSHEHPDRVREADPAVGRACPSYPDVREARCEAALVLDGDPAAPTRGRGGGEGGLLARLAGEPWVERLTTSADGSPRALGRAARRLRRSEPGGPPEGRVTLPSTDHNPLFPGLAAGALRHPDHRFERTRAEFHAWADRVAAEHGYRIGSSGIITARRERSAPAQIAVLAR